MLIGAALVFFLFPQRDEEQRLLAQYHDEDTKAAAAKPTPAGSTPAPSPA